MSKADLSDELQNLRVNPDQAQYLLYLQRRVGCTITRTRDAGTTAGWGGLGGAFRVVLELLIVHPQLPGETPLTARLTPGEWRVFRRTEAIEMKIVVGSSWRDPTKYALHSGRMGGWPTRGSLRCKSKGQGGGNRGIL